MAETHPYKTSVLSAIILSKEFVCENLKKSFPKLAPANTNA